MMDKNGSEGIHYRAPAQVETVSPIPTELLHSFATQGRVFFSNLKVTVERYGIKTCPECETQFNTTNVRPVQPGCGHIKCRVCYIVHGDCRQCNPEMSGMVGKPFPCSKCNQSFGLESTLEQHMRNHFVKRLFPCRWCRQVFYGDKALQQHIMLTHPGERPFGCGICEKAFQIQEDLDRHMKNFHNQPNEVTYNQVAEPYVVDLF